MSVFNCAGCDVLVYDLTYSDPTPPYLCQQCSDLAAGKEAKPPPTENKYYAKSEGV